MAGGYIQPITREDKGLHVFPKDINSKMKVKVRTCFPRCRSLAITQPRPRLTVSIWWKLYQCEIKLVIAMIIGVQHALYFPYFKK